MPVLQPEVVSEVYGYQNFILSPCLLYLHASDCIPAELGLPYPNRKRAPKANCRGDRSN